MAIASAPAGVLSSGAFLAVTRVLPLAMLVVSGWAVFSFRPSILVTLLVAAFFVAVSLTNGVALLGAGLGEVVVLVVAATFLALVGFTYARGVLLLDGRRPDTKSTGPLGYNVLGVAIDSAVPMAAALALVLVVGAVVAALGGEVSRLPEPLSTLASLYLQSRIGTVFTTILVAGAAVWVMRQLVEPVILHFTLSPADARKELLSEIEPTTKSVRKVARYRPSRGFAWGFLAVAYCAGIFAALVLFLPRAEVVHDLAATLDLRPPAPSPTEQVLEGAFQSAMVWTNIHYAQSQGYIRDIIRLLWG